MITEGKAKIEVSLPKTVSKAMDVFYNPVMKHNRDISVLLLKALNRKNMQIGLPLAGTGVRAVRFFKELPAATIKSIAINDYDPKAIKKIKKHLTANKANAKKYSVSKKDANYFLLDSKGFDYIDIDPYGTSNPFLDAAFKRIARDGILAVTNTDTASLAGAYPKVCKRLYWAAPLHTEEMHEVGLRILIRKIQLVGAQYDRAAIPIFSYFKDHYFRIFFKCVKGKEAVDAIIKQHGAYKEAGPMWLGSLWDTKLAKHMAKLSIEMHDKELSTFLKTIAAESAIPTVGFVDTHQSKKENIIQKQTLIEKIKKKSFKATNTHFLRTAVRTTMPKAEKLL